MVRQTILFAALALLVQNAAAHGRMTRLRAGGKTVWTRKGPGYENNPVASNTSPQFICRNSPKAPEITLVAGSTIEIEWAFTANHLGDGGLYLSYGNDKFFKIANFPEMNLSNNQFHTVTLPAWLPASKPNQPVVLRWEWYALHVFPRIEFYVQCTDVIMQGSAAALPADVKPYSVVAPSTLPDSGHNGEYRDGFNPTTWFFAKGAPACAPGVVGNCCNTAAYSYGLGGYKACAGVSGGAAPPTPPPRNTPAPTPAYAYPTPVPVLETRAPTPAGVSGGSCNDFKMKCQTKCIAQSGGVKTNQCWGTPKYRYCKCSDASVHVIPGYTCDHPTCPGGAAVTPAPASPTPPPAGNPPPSMSGGYVCPPNSYILSDRWPIVDLTDCKCGWGYEKRGDGCAKPGSSAAGPSPTPAPASPTPVPVNPTPAPKAPTTPAGGGAPYDCPPGSYIVSERWPIVSFDDCKCNWGYVRVAAAGGCATNGVAFVTSAQEEAVFVKEEAEVEKVAEEEEKKAEEDAKKAGKKRKKCGKACRKRKRKFKCPANSYVAATRFKRLSVKDCACNPGYAWSSDDVFSTDKVCLKILTADKVAAGAYACPDNAFMSSDNWPLLGFEDCTCAFGFQRSDAYERCDKRGKLAERYATQMAARLRGFGSVADFMRKAHDFKRTVAAAVGATAGEVTIDAVTPVVGDGGGAADGGLRRQLSLAGGGGGVEVDYSLLAGTADQSGDIEARLEATSDFAGSSVERVGEAPVADDAPSGNTTVGGFSPDQAVVFSALGFCVLVAAMAVVKVRNLNAHFARMGGPTPGISASQSNAFEDSNPMHGGFNPGAPPPRPKVVKKPPAPPRPPKPSMLGDVDQGQSIGLNTPAGASA